MKLNYKHKYLDFIKFRSQMDKVPVKSPGHTLKEIPPGFSSCLLMTNICMQCGMKITIWYTLGMLYINHICIIIVIHRTL